MNYAWIECPLCGGVYVRCTDPDFTPVDGITVICASDYLQPDGTPYISGIHPIPPCQTCGQGHPYVYNAANIRRGNTLPARGVSVGLSQ